MNGQGEATCTFIEAEAVGVLGSDVTSTRSPFGSWNCEYWRSFSASLSLLMGAGSLRIAAPVLSNGYPAGSLVDSAVHVPSANGPVQVDGSLK